MKLTHYTMSLVGDFWGENVLNFRAGALCSFSVTQCRVYPWASGCQGTSVLSSPELGVTSFPRHAQHTPHRADCTQKGTVRHEFRMMRMDYSASLGALDFHQNNGKEQSYAMFT